MVVGSHIAYVGRVNAVFVNRKEKRVGGESTYYFARKSVPPRELDFADPIDPLIEFFLVEGWAWISDPERNQAPFRVRPPPPPGVVRDDIRLVPVK